MIVRQGSWEQFHQHIRWNVPPRPAPTASPAAAAPVCFAAAAAVAGRRAAAPEDGLTLNAGLAGLIGALWRGFWRNP